VLGFLYAGDEISDPETHGAGACAEVTISSFIERLMKLNADFVDAFVDYSYDGLPIDEEGYATILHPYPSPEGEYRVIATLGSGDCPSGCIHDHYIYFESDADCDPVKLATASHTLPRSRVIESTQKRPTQRR
jgi:hypothetical protein